MNQIVKSMISRRCVRSYKPEQITEKELEDILEAGQYAPNAMGRQPVKMVVIQDKKTIAQLSKINAGLMGVDTDPFYGAPTVIVVLADKTVSTRINDGSLVIGNLMNAAYAVGVDSCWIHRAKEEFETDEGKSLLAKWGIEDNYEGIGHCILGYHDGEYPQAAVRKSDFIIRI